MPFSLYQFYALLIVVVFIRSSHTYYAFPRQGRASAKSYFFSRMGRAGAEDGSSYCCPEGVRRVVTSRKETFEICPLEQSCCNDMDERTKLYKDVIVTECESLAENKNMEEKLQNYLAESR